eukprot:3649618-Rhodomonas_salina.2
MITGTQDADLDEPPDDAVDPDPQRHQRVVAVRQPHDLMAHACDVSTEHRKARADLVRRANRKVVDNALWPECGEEGGDNERHGCRGHEDGSRDRGPEERILATPRRKLASASGSREIAERWVPGCARRRA